MNARESYTLTDLIALFALPSSSSLLCQRVESAVTEMRHAANAQSHMKTRQWHFTEIISLKSAGNHLCTTPPVHCFTANLHPNIHLVGFANIVNSFPTLMYTLGILGA